MNDSIFKSDACWLMCLALCVLTLCFQTAGQAQTATPKTSPMPSTATIDRSTNSGDVSNELIQKLSTALTGSTWSGQFTTTGGDTPRPESYHIKSAKHEGGNDWVITAQIAYGDRDVSVPVPVQIRWAGRTPVITLDSVTLPPLGTFDARVLLRRGQYAGTWRHGNQGGHLFGKYEKAKAELKKTPKLESKLESKTKPNH